MFILSSVLNARDTIEPIMMSSLFPVLVSCTSIFGWRYLLFVHSEHFYSTPTRNASNPAMKRKVFKCWWKVYVLLLSRWTYTGGAGIPGRWQNHQNTYFHCCKENDRFKPELCYSLVWLHICLKHSARNMESMGSSLHRDVIWGSKWDTFPLIFGFFKKDVKTKGGRTKG